MNKRKDREDDGDNNNGIFDNDVSFKNSRQFKKLIAEKEEEKNDNNNEHVENEISHNNNNKHSISTNIKTPSNIRTIHDYIRDEPNNTINMNPRNVSIPFSYTNIDTDNNGLHQISYLRTTNIDLSMQDKNLIEGSIENAFKNGKIDKETRRSAIEILNNSNETFLSSSSSAITFFQKLSPQQINQIAFDNFNKRCQERSGGIVNLFGKGIRRIIIGANTIASNISLAMSGVSSFIGIQRIATPMFGSVELISIDTSNIVRVSPVVYQMITDPKQFIIDTATSCAFIMLGGLLFCVTYCIKKSLNFFQEEIENIKSKESYYNYQQHLTWKQAMQLEKVENNFFEEWDTRRRDVLKKFALFTKTASEEKKYEEMMKNLSKKSHLLRAFMDDMRNYELENEIKQIDTTILNEFHLFKEKFIKICKEKNQKY